VFVDLGIQNAWRISHTAIGCLPGFTV